MSNTHWPPFLTARSVIAIAAVTTLLICTWIPASAADKADLYALLVGVGTYKNPSVNRINAPMAVTQIYDFLSERKHLFNNINVALLLNQHATKSNIVKALTKGLARAKKDDVVLLYMNSHGGVSPAKKGEHYFIAYDYDPRDPKTKLHLNDKKLYKNIKSERMLFVSGACHSGGFLAGLKRGRSLGQDINFLGNLKGRFGISSARADEVAVALRKYGMDIFGFYLIKGLKGAADVSKDGSITVKELYDYVADNVTKETNGTQHPQLFMATSDPATTTIYKTPVYKDKLTLDVTFHYEDKNGKVRTLTNESVLESRQKVGIAFKPSGDCHVHIFWKDTNGNVGVLFPNPELTEGTSLVRAGKEYWLPSQGGKRWYVLDKNPGTETIYFVASRVRNPKLETLVAQLQGKEPIPSPQSKPDVQQASTKKKEKKSALQKVASKLQREINLMGFAKYTVPVAAEKQAYNSKSELFKQVDSKINMAGADAIFTLTFKHVASGDVASQ